MAEERQCTIATDPWLTAAEAAPHNNSHSFPEANGTSIQTPGKLLETEAEALANIPPPEEARGGLGSVNVSRAVRAWSHQPLSARDTGRSHPDETQPLSCRLFTCTPGGYRR